MTASDSPEGEGTITAETTPYRAAADLDLLDEIEDLEDLSARPGFDLHLLTGASLRQPLAVRAIGGAVLALIVLVSPGAGASVIARLVGIGLVLTAGTSLWAHVLDRSGSSWRRTVPALVGAAIGIALIVAPTASPVALARLVGYGMLAVAARNVLRLLMRSRSEPRGWSAAKAAAAAAAGTLLVAFPSQVFGITQSILAFGWLALSLIVLTVALDSRNDHAHGYHESAELVLAWLANRPKSVDDRLALYDKILYEGPVRTRRVVRFLALMTFASVIASMGVLTDSTAVVIGAMLIAPLMTPLMGMAISLVMGWPHRLTASAVVAAIGIIVAIGIGLVLGLAVPVAVDTTTNSQIVSRSSPTILDLLIAVAAGSAGAYGLSRPDVSDSLPGVAISIALVPPLTVVGISYAHGDWASGNGALLLFATNMLAILVVGGLTFVITGVTPLQRVAQNQHRVRTWVAATVTAAAIVLGALLINGAQITSDVFDQSLAETTIQDWLAEYEEYALVSVDLAGDTITTTIVGPSDGVPAAASLADALATALDRPITAELRVLVEERSSATSGE